MRMSGHPGPVRCVDKEGKATVRAAVLLHFLCLFAMLAHNLPCHCMHQGTQSSTEDDGQGVLHPQ
eukprot:1161755-Pelagomonas_calceolata.AAC.15